ncbi:D-alanyl-D-alanine carboxypeptidase family protein [Romboutsia sp.]|uniref:D-alanyl-D-alanine carboxypeptidase family protein n=1 Tax=Romboutsia sp. TaxID=1965302 RepID=UPI003F36C14C
MNRILSLLASLLIAFTYCLGATTNSFATSSNPNLTAQYAVLMDYETGKILYEKNANNKLYPASTTKIWTAYVVLKHVSDLNKVVVIKDLPVVEGSSMYLKNGESFTVKQLLDGVLIHSSNDASVALAMYVSGSEEKFVQLMNEEAKLIGAKNTHFNNAHGLPDLDHYTTAHDMALMARKAMNNEIFRSIVKTPSIKFEASEVFPSVRDFRSTNKFLNSNEKIDYKGKEIPIEYDIVDGVKTGYTDDAGRCLVSSAVKDNMRLISAVFKTNGNDLYLDSRTLLDYGFDNYYSTTLVDKENYVNSKRVPFSKEKELIYSPEYSYKLVLPKGTKESEYTVNVNLADIKLPIKKADKVGTFEIYNGKKLEHTMDLVAKDNVNSIFSFITENRVLINTLKIASFILCVVLITFIIIIIRKKSRKSNKSIYSKKNRRRRR